MHKIALFLMAAALVVAGLFVPARTVGYHVQLSSPEQRMLNAKANDKWWESLGFTPAQIRAADPDLFNDGYALPEHGETKWMFLGSDALMLPNSTGGNLLSYANKAQAVEINVGMLLAECAIIVGVGVLLSLLIPFVEACANAQRLATIKPSIDVPPNV